MDNTTKHLKQARRLIRELVSRLDHGDYEENGDFPLVKKAESFLARSRVKPEYCWAIIGPHTRAVIGVCTDAGKAHAIDEDPGCGFRRISRKAYEEYGDADPQQWKIKHGLTAPNPI